MLFRTFFNETIMERRTKRTIGLISATFLGISSIIGSGWLFAAYRCAEVAGPAAIFSWLIGAIVISLLAMCCAEIAVLYPKRGLTAIIPTISHNKFFGFPFAIANWLGVIAVVGLESLATIQYLINLAPNLHHYFYYQEKLTLLGNTLSISLVIFYSIINYFGAKLLTKTNNFFSILKIIVPVITALIIIGVAFRAENFVHVGNTIVPYGYKSIFTAILTTGIIISFNGFQTVISFSSEIKKPQRTIPLSIILAISISFVVYLLLQIGFIGAMPLELLEKGWNNLEFHAPIVQLVSLMGIGFLAPVIYFGATIAPSGTAISFTGAATNMSTAMARNQQLPGYFSYLDKTHNVPKRALMLNVILAIAFLVIFRSWKEMAEILSLFHLVSYLPIPIALFVFRDSIKYNRYSFHIPFGKIVAGMLFVFLTYLFTMANFTVATRLMTMLAIFQGIFIALNTKSKKNFISAIKQCYALLIYFVAVLFFIWISPNNQDLIDENLYTFIVLAFGTGAFFLLSKIETGDVDLINSTVNIYEH